MQLGDTIAQALGYQGRHFRTVDANDPAALDAVLWGGHAPLGVRVPATFAATAEKRTTIGLALEHLAAHAPTPQSTIALPKGAPFGAIAIDAAKCTMCLACVGSCPVGAILDNQEKPQLRFVEAKCVQCGLCATTCPERAIALTPRLNLAPEARAPRVVNEAAVAQCIACGKPIGALDRLRMCADCRVVDMMKDGGIGVRDR